MADLKARIEAEMPEAGTQDVIAHDFADLPLSGYTLAGEWCRDCPGFPHAAYH